MMAVFIAIALASCHPILAFNHPGLLVTNADISRATTKIALGESPWSDSWNALIDLEYSNASYQSNAVEAIYRSDDGTNAANGQFLWDDAAAAFALALRWKISNDTSYADTAGWILTSWGEKLETLGGAGSDKYLTAGLQGYELTNAAELLRDYPPFAQNMSGFVTMLERVFLPLNYEFMLHEDGAEHNVRHFFANWELCNLASIMAYAVLVGNVTSWNFAVDYLQHGVGNGAINNAISNIVLEEGTSNELGQGQESGRDQGHSALDQQLLGAIAQQAWNQGQDFYSFNDSRILRGAEYFARYNLGHDVPFIPYTNGIVNYTTISNASRGATRPTWELLHNHYVRIKQMKAPWTTAYLNYTLSLYGGFEGGTGFFGSGSGNFDGLGWGSLLYRDDNALVGASANSSGNATSTTSYSTTAISTSLSSSGSVSIITSSPLSSNASSTNSVISPSASSTPSICEQSHRLTSSASAPSTTSTTLSGQNGPDHDQHHHHHKSRGVHGRSHAQARRGAHLP